MNNKTWCEDVTQWSDRLSLGCLHAMTGCVQSYLLVMLYNVWLLSFAVDITAHPPQASLLSCDAHSRKQRFARLPLWMTRPSGVGNAPACFRVALQKAGERPATVPEAALLNRSFLAPFGQSPIISRAFGSQTGGDEFVPRAPMSSAHTTPNVLPSARCS